MLQIHPKFSEKKTKCIQYHSEINTDSAIAILTIKEKLIVFIHLGPDDCKRKLKRLKIVTNKDETRIRVKFFVFPPDSNHQGKLEHGHVLINFD